MIASVSPQVLRVGVSGPRAEAHPLGMSDPRLWRVEYEKLLIEEALRRMRRQPPRDVKTWTIVSGMTRGERRFFILVSRLFRVMAWLRRIIRS